MPAMIEPPLSPGPSCPASYRALILEENGAVKLIEPILAANDAEAVALARDLVNGHAVDLWDGLRFIEHFDVEGWGS